jgi:general secretion pathway protein A
MYEEYYGLTERPFSLTPDPKFLYRSRSHADAFELLRYAIDRREGFVVVTGDIGTGKTTLCRALLEQVDRTTFTALVLNPFLTEEDLLKRVLQDFGVVDRDAIRDGRLTGLSKQDLIELLHDFLLGLPSDKANAVLIIDEAQNLPLAVLEQVRMLSNLETDKEKLLQIILVGQLNLQTLLRSPELRQLDQRVSIRYELQPLDEEAAAAYVAHRLAVAGGSASVQFTRKALTLVHRLSGGVPRVINLICDRALLAGYAAKTDRITPDHVREAAEGLDLAQTPRGAAGWLARPRPLAASAAVVLSAAAVAVVGSTLVYARLVSSDVQASSSMAGAAASAAGSGSNVGRRFPAEARFTVLVSTYAASEAEEGVPSAVRWIEAMGATPYETREHVGASGVWHRVYAGAYPARELAAREAVRLERAAPGLNVAVVELALPRGAAR